MSSPLCPMVIGASFGGRKSMTATSGPGLSLKTEALGLAVHAEIPCVIVDVQRGGPSTGMPTQTEQSDLQLAVYGAHGDAPRVVLAAEDVKTCFDETVRAFYISEKYQCPVIVLSDQAIGHGSQTVAADAFEREDTFRKVARRLVPTPNPERPYQRYELNDRPVSPMSHPGIEGCAYQTSGLIHAEDGRPSFESETHRLMSDRVADKLRLVADEFPGQRRIGPHDARHGIVAWGSSVGVAVEAAERRTEAGQPTDVFAVETLSPAAGRRPPQLPRRTRQRRRLRADALRPVCPLDPSERHSPRRCGPDLQGRRRPVHRRPAPGDSGGGVFMTEAKKYGWKDYRSDLQPVWCPGCGDFSVLAAIYRALSDLAGPAPRARHHLGHPAAPAGSPAIRPPTG